MCFDAITENLVPYLTFLFPPLSSLPPSFLPFPLSPPFPSLPLAFLPSPSYLTSMEIVSATTRMMTTTLLRYCTPFCHLIPPIPSYRQPSRLHPITHISISSHLAHHTSIPHKLHSIIRVLLSSTSLLTPSSHTLTHTLPHFIP